VRHYKLPGPKESLTAIISYKAEIEPTAAKVAREVVVVNPEVLRRIARRAFGVQRQVRGDARGKTDEQLKARFAELFIQFKLDSPMLAQTFRERRVAAG
jgi:hypothetical protein